MVQENKYAQDTRDNSTLTCVLFNVCHNKSLDTCIIRDTSKRGTRKTYRDLLCSCRVTRALTHVKMKL